MNKEELEKESEEYALKQWEGQIPWGVIQKSYYDGAEPREKRIEELIALINAERERQEKCDDVHLRKIAELEKENAELKEKLNIRSCQNCRNYNKTCPNDGSCKHYSKWEGYENPQLTKAKEIIKTCLGFMQAFGYSPSIDKFVTDAEQFLSEVEK